MDPYVIDIPWILRWFLVNVIIVPKRSHSSAALYKNIWTEEGSPLLVNSQKLLKKYQVASPDTPVGLAMRYGNPSIEGELQKLINQGVDTIRVFPLYPQYATSSVKTSLEECRRILKKLNFQGKAEYYGEFYDDPRFIAPLAQSIQTVLDRENPDYLLYSYHGLPEHQVAATGKGCRFDSTCCAQFKQNNPHCYRAQCIETTNSCNSKLNWPSSKTTIAYQSRLGNRPWLKPYTDVVVKELAAQGVRKLAVVCPAFTADCLETLEEISIRIQEDFQEAGGKDVVLVPCLNDHDSWVDGLSQITDSAQKFDLLNPAHA